MKQTIDKEKLAQFLEALRGMEIYQPLRAQGHMTSGQVCEACEVVEDKINELITEHFGEFA